MAEDDKPPLALVQFKDVLGLSAPATRLADAIARGIGEWFYPLTKARRTSADVNALKQWSKALKSTGLSFQSADLSLENRAVIRLTAQVQRQQRNREAVAVQAIEEFKTIQPDTHTEAAPPIDLSWIDRLWCHAENASDADFQSLWGRVLARQASGSARYSARCLDTLGALSRDEAKLLERLATVALRTDLGDQGSEVCIVFGARNYIEPGEAVSTLRDENLKVAAAVGNVHPEILGPIGIMIETGWAHDLVGIVHNNAVRLRIGGAAYRIKGYPSPLPEHRGVPFADGVKIGGGYQFSPVGAEIVSLIQTAPDDAFVRAFGGALAVQGLQLEKQ
jgi:hypothetical protein